MGMGLGGASRSPSATCVNCVKTPINDPTDPTKGVGYSSYFALDITDPLNPQFLWEFSNEGLGYTTAGPAIVRVKASTGGLADSTKNGKWYAVFASGPTGPIDTVNHQFLGTSDQNLNLFVVDLATGTLVREIDTGIANAFAGSIVGGSMDADRWNPNLVGNYQDDVVYMGYVQANSNPVTAATTWTNGGILRLLTKENINPISWVASKVIDNIGPVTTAIARLQDFKNHNLWLFTGTGRYYYHLPGNLDDNLGQRALFGIKEPCYLFNDSLDPACTVFPLSLSDLTDQTSASNTTVNKGWYINLDAANNVAGTGAERVVTDTVALTNGSVFFTTFEPTLDVCGYGGNSYMWGTTYNTGLQPAANTLQAKCLIQLSTGEFKELSLSSIFTNKNNRRMATPMTGKPPADSSPIITTSGNKPMKRIIHIQER